MKKALRSFTTFNKKERLGILLLSILLGLLLMVRISMRYWVHSPGNDSATKNLEKRWDSFKKANANIEFNDSIVAAQQNWLDRTDGPVAPVEDPIHINTADSATLVRLKGIGPATAGKILRWRREKGVFHTVDEILLIHHIPDSTFKLIKKHLTVQ